MANEYLGECHTLCFIENRKGISQIYPKIKEFVQFIYFPAKLIPNRMFLECFIGLTEVTKESWCYGYPLTKEKQNGK